MLARRTSVWRAPIKQMLFCLAFVALLCRSVVPAGFMPASPGERGHGFALTFCLAGNGQVLLAQQIDDAPTDPQAGHLDCPFDLVASQGVLPLHDTPAIAAAITYRSVISAPNDQSLPPLPAQGPPLGPRAPPSILS